MTSYIYAALGAAIVAMGFWVQTLRLEVSQLQTDKARIEAVGKQAALDHAVVISERQSRHAASQQTKEQTYAKEKKRLASQRDVERTAAAGLRKQLETATANAGGPVDTATCERDRDRLASLGTLVGEGVELVAEGRSVLEERAAEIENLKSQIAADRAACSPKEL